MSASLQVDKQESLAQDKFARNGVAKVLHIVAKNIAFILHVSSSTVNLNSSPLTAKLFYDFDTEEEQKEVDTLKATPLEYTAHVTEDGTKADVEVKLNVLSSQHEGAFFRIQLSTDDTKAHTILSTWTHPIKVISKRNQVRKMLMRNEISTDQISQPELKTPLPKRISNEEITEQLQTIQRQQEEQSLLLQQLLSNQSPSFGSKLQIPDPREPDFEVAFATFLRSFQKLPNEQRSTKVAKVLGAMTPHDGNSLASFCDLYCNMADQVFGIVPSPSPGVEDDNQTGGYSIPRYSRSSTSTKLSAEDPIDYSLSPQSMLEFLGSSSPDGYSGEPDLDDLLSDLVSDSDSRNDDQFVY